MTCGLLLQSTVTLSDGILPAVYGALTAAVLSFLASVNATIIASRTAREVADLAARTARDVADLSAQTVREIAALSALVSRETAGLAAQTAREIKDQDYKHDFYKKIIAKRLDAWEEAERFLAQLIDPLIDNQDKKMFFKFCTDGREFDALIDKIRCEMTSHMLWMGVDYANILVNIHNKFIDIRKESVLRTAEFNLSAIDNKLLVEAGKKHHSECELLFNSLSILLGKQMIILHDVEAFFKHVENYRPKN